MGATGADVFAAVQAVAGVGLAATFCTSPTTVALGALLTLTALVTR